MPLPEKIGQRHFCFAKKGTQPIGESRKAVFLFLWIAAVRGRFRCRILGSGRTGRRIPGEKFLCRHGLADLIALQSVAAKRSEQLHPAVGFDPLGNASHVQVMAQSDQAPDDKLRPLRLPLLHQHTSLSQLLGGLGKRGILHMGPGAFTEKTGCFSWI